MTTLGVVEFINNMLLLRAASRKNPLCEGTTFTLLLQAPTRTETENNTGPSRLMPALPYGIESSFELVRALQSSSREDYRNAEVWLARPVFTSAKQVEVDDEGPTIVFKFVIPSHTRLPDVPVAGSIVKPYVRPEEHVDSEVKAFEALPDYQGTTLPYFFGCHEVQMPWGEGASLLAMEYIRFEVKPEMQCSITDADIEEYVRMFSFSIKTLLQAHSRGIIHGDIKPDNILLDQAHSRAVLIDWTSLAPRAGHTQLSLEQKDWIALYKVFTSVCRQVVEPIKEVFRREVPLAKFPYLQRFYVT